MTKPIVFKMPRQVYPKYIQYVYGSAPARLTTYEEDQAAGIEKLGFDFKMLAYGLHYHGKFIDFVFETEEDKLIFQLAVL